MSSVAESVAAALAGRAEADPRDAAAERLALTYAGLMDEAAPARKYRKALDVLRRHLAGTGWEEDQPDEALELVAEALAEHSVASDLGPKLLSALASLGLTTASRGKSAEGGRPSDPRNPLDQLKRKREQRLTSAG